MRVRVFLPGKHNPLYYLLVKRYFRNHQNALRVWRPSALTLVRACASGNIFCL